MAMSKGRVIGLVVVAIVLIVVVALVFWIVGTFNSLVNENEKVDAQWAQVTNQYQRKIDLIPALVANLTDYEEFESGTLSNITALRSRWMNASGDGQVNATNELDRQLISIQVTYEAYPDLKSIEAVRAVMYELAGTENRITVERGRYNDAVKDFNAHIKRFPASMVAGWGAFEERSYYVSPNAPPPPGT